MKSHRLKSHHLIKITGFNVRNHREANDNSCNNTITENSESEFIYNKISSHLNERRKEFLNLNS